ncbi:MAG TPA: MMPL family transporter [Pirellulaceae bacterium]|nr:MMPL family transporter [Pirellulaceae bacterium]
MSNADSGAAAPRSFVRLVEWRYVLAAIGLAIALAAYGPSGRVAYNRSIENMFASGDRIVEPYQRLKRVFGGNELVLAVYVDPELLEPDGRGIRRLSEISQRLQKVPGVREVLSLDRPVGDVIVDAKNPAAAALRDVFAGYTHGRDGRTVAAVCMLDSNLTSAGAAADAPPPDRGATIRAIRDIITNLPDGLAPGMVAGEPVLVEDGFSALEADGRRLRIWSTLLVAATILVCFRSLRWVVLSLLVVEWTLLATGALLSITGRSLTLVSSMWASIITVVGIATVVHLLVRFRELRMTGLAPRDALIVAGRAVAWPIVWSLVTDVAGFGSLACSDVGPVRDFGLMTAAGSALVLASIVLLTPCLALVGNWDSSPGEAWGERGLGRGLAALIDGVTRRPGLVWLISIIVVVFAAAGVGRLEVETDFTRNFRQGSPLVQSYEFIESNLGGAGVLDVMVPAPEKLDWQTIARVRDLEKRLREEVRTVGPSGEMEPGLTKVLSLADALIGASPVDPAKLPFEAARDVLVQSGWEVMRARLPAFSSALYSNDPEHPERWWLRVMLRAKERQPAAAKLQLIEQIERIVAEETGRAAWQRDTKEQPAAVTGYFVLLTNLIASTVRDQWISFGVASLGVAVTLLLAFRRPRWVLVALVPNALPIFLVLGCLGWLGLRMNLGAAMIAAVSMGLSVDSSIHYLTSYGNERRAGRSVVEALAIVQQSVGRAMVFSTLALTVGFTVLCLSPFVPTIYFGLLVSLAMAGGLAGNLVLLPLLLRATER